MLTRLRRIRRARSVFVTARERPETYGDVYLVYADEVLRYFARQTLDPGVAFRLMAETFATALDDRELFRGTNDEEGQSWLFAIAASKLTPWQQRGVLDRRKVTKFGMILSSLGREEFERIEEYADLQRFQPALDQEIQTLPTALREVMQLRLTEGQSYKMIAETLGEPSDEICYRASCALQQLARQLEGPIVLGAGVDGRAAIDR